MRKFFMLVLVAMFACTGCGGGDTVYEFGYGSGILEGNAIIYNAEDLERYQGYDVITGHLTIYGEGMSNIELPNLQIIGGDLMFDFDYKFTVENVDFSSLREVGGNFILRFTSLQNLTGFKNVELVADCTITSNPELPDCVAQSFCEQRILAEGTVTVHENNPDTTACN